MIVVNLIGGSGCGKSTLMAQVFAELKKLFIETEMAPEWIKLKVWEESFKVMDDQIYVFGKQLHSINRLVGKVDVIICDSPLINCIVYDKTHNDKFSALVLDQFNRFENLNFFIKRSTSYVVKGRIQTEEEAKKIDQQFLDVLKNNKIPYEEVDKDEAIFIIVGRVLEELKKKQTPENLI